MKLSARHLLRILVTALCLAQTGTTKVRADLSSAADVKFDLHFSGGTVSELVARVHRMLWDQKVEQVLNIVVLPEHAVTPIPTMTLQQVSFRELSAFLHSSSAERARSSVSVGRASQVVEFKESSGIWHFVVQTQEGVGRAEVKQITDRVAVYRVKAAADVDVLGVLRDTFRAEGRKTPSSLTYQTASQSLILRGDEKDHSTALRAVQLLEQDLVAQNPEIRRLQQEKAALSERCAVLERDLQALKSQVNSLR
jgi:hypothetical protein